MKQIIKAISDFQKDCPVIDKGETGYNYNYTSMVGLFKIIKPLLAKHKLTPIFLMDFNEDAKCNMLILQIIHESGETVVSQVGMPNGVELIKMNTYQVMGSGISYLKRYLIISALSIVTAERDADECLQDNSKPANTEGKDVRSAHTGKKVTGKQIDTGDLL